MHWRCSSGEWTPYSESLYWDAEYRRPYKQTITRITGQKVQGDGWAETRILEKWRWDDLVGNPWVTFLGSRRGKSSWSSFSLFCKESFKWPPHLEWQTIKWEKTLSLNVTDLSWATHPVITTFILGMHHLLALWEYSWDSKLVKPVQKTWHDPHQWFPSKRRHKWHRVLTKS